MRTHTHARTHAAYLVISLFYFYLFCFSHHLFKTLVPNLVSFFWAFVVRRHSFQHQPTHFRLHTGYLSPTAKPPTKTPKKLPSLAYSKTTTPTHSDGALFFLHSCIPASLLFYFYFLLLFRLASIRSPNKSKVNENSRPYFYRKPPTIVAPLRFLVPTSASSSLRQLLSCSPRP